MKRSWSALGVDHWNVHRQGSRDSVDFDDLSNGATMLISELCLREEQ